MAKIWTVGDIHGTITALDTLLAMIDLQPDDTFITLGDYVNRGNESARVLDRLIELHQLYNVISILGNHDQIMKDALAEGPSSQWWSNWMSMGGKRTLASYEAENAIDPRRLIPQLHIDFLQETCLELHEDDEYVYTHARISHELPLSNQSPYMLRWESIDESYVPHPCGKTLICGHTSQKDGRVWQRRGVICIDTSAWAGGWLTALDLSTFDVCRANMYGKTEQGPLDQFC